MADLFFHAGLVEERPPPFFVWTPYFFFFLLAQSLSLSDNTILYPLFFCFATFHATACLQELRTPLFPPPPISNGMRSGVASVVAAAGVALLLVACLPAPAQAYLPGVKTQEFFATDPVELKVLFRV